MAAAVKSLAAWRTAKPQRRLPQRVKIEPYYVYIGQIIREQRERLGLSQQDIALALGHRSPASISRIENAQQRVMLHQLQEIANVLRLPLLDLLPAKLPMSRKPHGR